MKQLIPASKTLSMTIPIPTKVLNSKTKKITLLTKVIYEIVIIGLISMISYHCDSTLRFGWKFDRST